MNHPPDGRERISAARTAARAGRERRAYRRAITGMLASALIVPLLLAWALMLMADVAHHDWWRQMPPMGFRAAWLLTGLACAALAAVMYVITAWRDWAKS